MNCNKCDRALLPQDDVNSSRYKEMGCLQCQISIMANHKYGSNIEMVPHGITPVEATLAITKDQALAILRLTAFANSEGKADEGDLTLAKKLIEHFHVCDFGWLLTSYDDLCERKRLKQ